MSLTDRISLQTTILLAFTNYYKVADSIINEEEKAGKGYLANLYYYIYKVYTILSTKDCMTEAIESFLGEIVDYEGVEEEKLVILITSIDRYTKLYLLEEMTHLVNDSNIEFNDFAIMVQMDLLLQYCLIAISLYNLEIEDMYTGKEI